MISNIVILADHSAKRAHCWWGSAPDLSHWLFQHWRKDSVWRDHWPSQDWCPLPHNSDNLPRSTQSTFEMIANFCYLQAPFAPLWWPCVTPSGHTPSSASCLASFSPPGPPWPPRAWWVNQEFTKKEICFLCLKYRNSISSVKTTKTLRPIYMLKIHSAKRKCN